jgi:hypothetical protein
VRVIGDLQGPNIIACDWSLLHATALQTWLLHEKQKTCALMTSRGPKLKRDQFRRKLSDVSNFGKVGCIPVYSVFYT